MPQKPILLQSSNIFTGIYNCMQFLQKLYLENFSVRLFFLIETLSSFALIEHKTLYLCVLSPES